MVLKCAYAGMLKAFVVQRRSLSPGDLQQQYSAVRACYVYESIGRVCKNGMRESNGKTH